MTREDLGEHVNSSIYEAVKPSNLVDIINCELDLKEMPVEKGDKFAATNTKGDYIDPKDYYEFSMSDFSEKTSRQLLKSENENLKKIFSNQVVVDLGSSYTPWAYYTAMKSGAEAYVAVDCSRHIKMLPWNISSLLSKNNLVDEQIPLVPVQGEILSFLDASIRANKRYSFICSSYGNYPDDTSLFSVKFFDYLIDMLPKATSQEGGVLTIYTNVADNHHFQKLEPNSEIKYSGFYKLER